MKRVPSLQGLVLLSAPLAASAVSGSMSEPSAEILLSQPNEEPENTPPRAYDMRGSPLTVNEFYHQSALQSLYHINLDGDDVLRTAGKNYLNADRSVRRSSAAALLEDRMGGTSVAEQQDLVGGVIPSSTKSTTAQLWDSAEGPPRPQSVPIAPFRSPPQQHPSNQHQLFGGTGNPLAPGTSTTTTTQPVVPQQQQQQQQQQQGSDSRQYKTRLCVYLSSPGGCPHGSRCFFAHGIQELRPIINTTTAAVCPPATTSSPQNGAVQPPALQRSQSEYKTKPCRYSYAECPFAAVGRCQFAHSLDELRGNTNAGTQPAQAAPGPPSAKTSPLLGHRSPPQTYSAFGSLPGQQQQQQQQPPVGGGLNRPTSDRIPVLSASQQKDDSHAAQQAAAAAANHARRFKTRLCKYHMAGHCPYAATNTCQFAHSEEELRAPPQRTWRPSSLDTQQHWYHANANGVGNHQPTTTNTAANPAAAVNPSVPQPTPEAAEGGVVAPQVQGKAVGGQVASAPSYQQQQQPQQPQQSPMMGPQQPTHTNPNQQAQQQPPTGNQPPHQSGAALRAALEQKRFTKLCKYFLAGHCPFAASGTCQFAHSASELRRRSPPPGPLGVPLTGRSPPGRHRKPDPLGSFDLPDVTGLGETSNTAMAIDGWSDVFSLRRQPDWSFNSQDTQATATL